MRLDLQAAGGSAVGIRCTEVAAAYQGILNELWLKAPQIQVIGLLSNEFMYHTWPMADAEQFATLFADKAGEVACSSAYAPVDVWEISNEPDIPQTRLEPADYARLLGLSSRKIRDCPGDLVISGGITTGEPVSYLTTVGAVIAANGYGDYSSLLGAVDGSGVHPYVDPIGAGEAGHTPLDAFLNNLLESFGLPIYITEFGWEVTANFDEARQCHNLVNAFALINTRWAGIVPAATWLTLQDWVASTDVYTGGLTTSTGCPGRR